MLSLFRILSSILFLVFANVGISALDNRLKLTEEECAWLLENPVIRVGVEHGYPPANFWDENGRVRGIDADFLSAISELTGATFEFVKMDSWVETVAAVKNRELDLLTCLTSTPEREEFLAFTQVYYDFPIAIITPSDAEFYSTPSAMRGKVVAVPEGFVTHEVMRRIGWDVEVMFVPTITDAYLAVATGQCDATVGNLGNASYLIPRLGITNLKISGVMPEFTRSRFAVRKDWAILAGIIDKYFASLSEVERNAMIEKWVRLDVPEQFDWGPLLRIALGMALIGFVVLGFMLWRNRDLRHQLEERQRHQAAMEAAHTRVSRLSEERSDLLHMVAHDLRGPLMAFQTGVGLVNERTKISKDSDLTGVLTRMDRQTEAMQGLIDGLLDVEAIENGSRRLGRNPVNFRACVEVVIERFQPRAQSKGIEIEWSAPVGDLKVKGDMVAIRQVVENLVSNAVKYSPIGGRVAMRMVEEDNEIRFEVRDNGPGIAQDEFSRLFKKFSRLSAKPTDGESSHGMGLFIVKSLVDSMKGKVWCESQLGRGATFLVSFTQAG
jgi:signal transduction histidine kinase